ncbi:MAG: endonuclease/exonuclease/phosphatase family protein [Kiritimatiellae bacterium]|nr:endonuclease/exonuclease/phosphatase family protein [Kiritimatiellia bacterium]
MQIDADRWQEYFDRAGLLVMAATAAGFGGSWFWLFDHAAHFRLQYLLALIFLAWATFLARRYRRALLYVSFAAVNLAVILPLCLPPPTLPERNAPHLRVLSINVLSTNNSYDSVTHCIRKAGADFVVLQEVTPRWLRSLEPLRSEYPHIEACAEEGYSGIALLSRHPFTHAEIVRFGDGTFPAVMGQFEIAGRRLAILGVHPPRPGGSWRADCREVQFAKIPEYLARLDGAKIVTGDLNSTPWSCYFQRLLREADLHDSAQGRGVQPTWPACLFPLQIPIDHCLLSPDLHTLDRRVGPFVGSDHQPLLVDFTFAQKG